MTRSEKPPLIRAAHVRSNLTRLSVLGSSNAQRIRASLRASSIDQIEHARAVTWFPVSLDLELTEAVGRLCGESALRMWSLDTITRSVEGPLLRPLLDGAVRMFGLNPRPIIGLIPRAWDHLYRNAGGLRVVHHPEDGPSSMTLEYVDVPPIIYESELYLDSVAASFSIVLDLCRAPGDVRHDRCAGVTTLRFDWAAQQRTASAG